MLRRQGGQATSGRTRSGIRCLGCCSGMSFSSPASFTAVSTGSHIAFATGPSIGSSKKYEKAPDRPHYWQWKFSSTFSLSRSTSDNVSLTCPTSCADQAPSRRSSARALRLQPIVCLIAAPRSPLFACHVRIERSCARSSGSCEACRKRGEPRDCAP